MIYWANNPCIANWVVKKTAKDQTKLFQKSNWINFRTFLHGPFLDSFSSQAEARNIGKEISEILKKRGFHLTKFVSNDWEILKSLPQVDLSVNC